MMPPINDDEDGDDICGCFVGEEQVSDAPKTRDTSRKHYLLSRMLSSVERVITGRTTEALTLLE